MMAIGYWIYRGTDLGYELRFLTEKNELMAVNHAKYYTDDIVFYNNVIGEGPYNNQEFRAIFEHPEPWPLTEYGPVRDTLEEAQKERPHRSEESRARHVGVQTRYTTDWMKVSE